MTLYQSHTAGGLPESGSKWQWGLLCRTNENEEAGSAAGIPQDLIKLSNKELQMLPVNAAVHEHRRSNHGHLRSTNGDQQGTSDPPFLLIFLIGKIRMRFFLKPHSNMQMPPWREVAGWGSKSGKKNWVILKRLGYFKSCLKLFHYILIELKLKFYFLLLKGGSRGRLMKWNK